MLDKTSSIICAFGLAAAAPRSPYRHLELCGIALTFGHISSVLRTNILCHLQFGTHQQESTNTVQVICDAGTVTVELIAANTSSDADMTDLDILTLPFQAVHNAVKGTFCSIQYYLRFWLGICRTSLAVSVLRIMRYCLRYTE